MESNATPIHHFLVEIWVETRQISGALPLIRARTRDLDSGTERYVKSRLELTDFIEESITRAGRTAWRWQGEGE